MKCRKCQFENPPGTKFCNECGSKLEVVCPRCTKPNLPGSKFCGECGHNLTSSADTVLPKDLSFDEKLAKIQKYLPGGLTEKILSQRDRIEGERRHVTIMFVDMKGFTPLTEKLGPEVTFSLMDKVFELLIHKVHEYEGTVNELRGDGVLAFFGAPIALEDAPQRAIRSSLAIHRELTRFNDKLKAEKNIPPVLVRIGINSGPVVVGTVGNDLRVQFTAVGDTINMAARMEQMAEPGTTYVTEETFKLTEGFFRFEALGEKQIKGKEKPLKVYRVIAPSSRTTRFDVSAERGLSRFIGRERELELLLDSFERAKAGRGQAVSIMGEAGVGKSRLLYEFRKAVTNEDILFLEGKCLSYGRGVAYHPIIDVLKSNFGIDDGDADSDVTGKVKRGLTLLGVDEASTLPYLLELLSVKDSGLDSILMSPEAKKDRIQGALQRIILKGSEHRPLVFAFEDLHWMDKSSEEAAKCLLESIPGARVLMIFTYRPEFVHTWGGKSFHSQVNINRLSNHESLAMMSDLLGSDAIALDLQELILQKTEGVPFFTEEFVRSLQDMEIIQRTNDTYHLAKDLDRVAIPSTIQDVIMARVDSLPDAPKEVLQAGSAIEREFTYELIKAVTELPEQELLSHLSVLKDVELIYERGIFPHATYIFRHALTREVVYDSILAKRKKRLHGAIGDAIKHLPSENVEASYTILAQHFVAAENYEKGAEYSRLARKQSMKTGSANEAIAYAMKNVECLEQLPQSAEVLERIVAGRTVLGFHHGQVNRHVEAKEAIDPIADSALKSISPTRRSQILSIIGSHAYLVEENFPKAIECLREAGTLAERARDYASVTQAEFWLGLGLCLNCDFESGLSCLQRTFTVCMDAKSLWGASLTKANIGCFGYYFQGKIKPALDNTHEAIRIAEEGLDIYPRTIAHACHGIACYGRGTFDLAIEHLVKGIELAEKINYLYWVAANNHFLGDIYFEDGSYEVAGGHYRNAIRTMQENRTMPSWVNLSRTALAKASIMTDHKGVDLESLFAYAVQCRLKILEGWKRRYLAEILLILGDQHFSEAQHWVEEAIEADERNGTRWHQARDIAVYAELFKRKGDKDKAKEQLGKAIEIYKECGADGWVTRAEEELARLS